MFNQEQLQLLNQELDSSRIKSRSKGNINLSYLEGFDLIETANKVFGYGNWSYSIESLEHLSTEQNQNQNFVICYKAIVKVTVFDKEHIQNISRSDVGTGTGIAKTQSEAHEGATKEAVTDALKRALRSFGNQFGLSLYDKSRNHTNNSSYNQQPNYNQSPNNANQQQYNPPQNQQQTVNNAPQEYSSLYQLGLQIVADGNGNLIVTGDDQYNKRDSIKACGFKFSASTKQWWKPIQQQAA